MKELLKRNKLSATSARIEMLQSLKEAHIPMTIEMIRDVMKQQVSPSTLYRSLKAMVDAGIIYQTDFREGVSYYEYQGTSHHHHVTCTSCKQQEEVPLCFVADIQSLKQHTSFTITSHIIEFFGLCKNCSQH